eukprot:6401323-Prymnesium_polylepis.1
MAAASRRSRAIKRLYTPPISCACLKVAAHVRRALQLYALKCSVSPKAVAFNCVARGRGHRSVCNSWSAN